MYNDEGWYDFYFNDALRRSKYDNPEFKETTHISIADRIAKEKAEERKQQSMADFLSGVFPNTTPAQAQGQAQPSNPQQSGYLFGQEANIPTETNPAARQELYRRLDETIAQKQGARPEAMAKYDITSGGRTMKMRYPEEAYTFTNQDLEPLLRLGHRSVRPEYWKGEPKIDLTTPEGQQAFYTAGVKLGIPESQLGDMIKLNQPKEKKAKWQDWGEEQKALVDEQGNIIRTEKVKPEGRKQEQIVKDIRTTAAQIASRVGDISLTEKLIVATNPERIKDLQKEGDPYIQELVNALGYYKQEYKDTTGKEWSTTQIMPSKTLTSQDQKALDAGYTWEEIQAYKKKKGIK